MKLEPIRRLSDKFLSHSFGPEQAVAEFGEVSARSERRWTLSPKMKGVRSIQLSFENLNAGNHLLTAVHFKLLSPQPTTLSQFEECFGVPARWLPRNSSKMNFHVLVIDREETETSYMGALHFESNSSPRIDDSGNIKIDGVKFRRFYP
jgi:hypothetical protein